MAVRAQAPALGLYRKVLQKCARAGHRRAQAQTPGEFSRGLAARGFPGAEVVEAATTLYYRTRYGGHVPHPAELAAVSEKLDQIGARP